MPEVDWTSQARRPREAMRLSFTVQSDDARWRLVQRIAASSVLSRSALLVNFLLFVCDRYLTGRAAEITEKQVGIHVFGRPEGYNAADDNVVRNYARMLRKRLEEYFATEGAHEEMTVVIPRGGYVPVFSPRLPEFLGAPGDSRIAGENELKPTLTKTSGIPPGEFHASHSTGEWNNPGGNSAEAGGDAAVMYASAEEDLPGTVTARELSASSRSEIRIWQVLLGVATVVLSALAGVIVSRHLPSFDFRPANRAATLSRHFWSSLFEGQRDTFLVPGDGGLVMLQTFIRQHVSLEDYANGAYRKDSRITQGVAGLMTGVTPGEEDRLVRKVEAIGNRRYTSLTDLELTTQLSRLPEVFPERLMIRYARDLRIDDLRSGDAILIGSIEANPWVDLFQQQLNFRFSHGADFGGSGIIRNLHPRAGERDTYGSEPNDPLLRTYGIIAYVPNLSGNGHVLMIEGVNMAGTQAAGEFLLDPEMMQPILEHATGKHDEIRPFEVLVETDNIAANSSRPHVISERIGPA